MARLTLDEEIAQYENIRDSLQEKVEEFESYKELKAQGSDGATTQFVDPEKIYTRIDKINNRLAVLYRRKESI